MPLRIPERHHDLVVQLLRLSDHSWGALVGAMKQVQPTFSLQDYAERVAASAPEQIKARHELVKLLASLLAVRERYDATKEFLGELREAAEELAKPDLKLENEDWDRFERRLDQLLSTKSSIELTAKAAFLNSEHERTLHEARIISDLRPVFRADVGQPPAAMFISHTLRLAFHEEDTVKEFYIALDIGDLQKLRGIINRAMKKHKSLRSLLEDRRILYMETEGEEDL